MVTGIARDGTGFVRGQIPAVTEEVAAEWMDSTARDFQICNNHVLHRDESLLIMRNNTTKEITLVLEIQAVE